MIHIDIIAVGRMRKDALKTLCDEFCGRMQWRVTLHEIDTKKPQDETRQILGKIDPQAYVFVMDERGKSLPSEDFAQRIETQATQGTSRFQFIIGGADGHSEEIRKKADFLLSFGAQTWPHMLARVMLLEQLYRAQQIIAGHPYHRA
jgi:23S rRNA (pseudouridine1915-N3)-methyltransferase